MFSCSVLYQVGKTARYHFTHVTKEIPETISDETWNNHIVLERNYRKPVKILKVTWEKVCQASIVKENIPDINMDDTQINNLKEKIAQLTNHGLNAREIAREIRHISKTELVAIIMGYQTLE
jgi:hypothetical protein